MKEWTSWSKHQRETVWEGGAGDRERQFYKSLLVFPFLQEPGESWIYENWKLFVTFLVSLLFLVELQM